MPVTNTTATLVRGEHVDTYLCCQIRFCSDVTVIFCAVTICFFLRIRNNENQIYVGTYVFAYK